MKKTILVSATIFFLALAACDDNKGENKSTSGETKTETSAASGLSVQQASDSLSASDESKGKEVTINAYSWGVSETTNGTVRLNLGDEKAEGMVVATFYAEFPGAKTEELKKIAKNARVKVKGKLGSDAYAKFIKDCELMNVE